MHPEYMLEPCATLKKSDILNVFCVVAHACHNVSLGSLVDKASTDIRPIRDPHNRCEISWAPECTNQADKLKKD